MDTTGNDLRYEVMTYLRRQVLECAHMSRKGVMNDDMIFDPRFEVFAYNRQAALVRGRQASQIYDFPIKKKTEYFRV